MSIHHLEIINKLGTFVSEPYDFAESELAECTRFCEQIADGSLSYITFNDAQGNTRYFNQSILKESIISIISG